MLEYADTIAAFIVTSVSAAEVGGLTSFEFSTHIGLDHIPFKLKDHNLELIMQACSAILGGVCIEGLATFIVVESHIMIILLLVLLIPIGILLILIIICLCCKGCPRRVNKEKTVVKSAYGVRAGNIYVNENLYGTVGGVSAVEAGLNLQGGVVVNAGAKCCAHGNEACCIHGDSSVHGSGHVHTSGHVQASGQVHAKGHIHGSEHLHLHESVHISGHASPHIHGSGHVHPSGHFHAKGHLHGSGHLHLHESVHISGHANPHVHGSGHVHVQGCDLQESLTVDGHGSGHLHGSGHIDISNYQGAEYLNLQEGLTVDGQRSGHVHLHGHAGEGEHVHGSEHIHLHMHASGGVTQAELEKEVQQELDNLGIGLSQELGGEMSMEITVRESASEGSEGGVGVMTQVSRL